MPNPSIRPATASTSDSACAAYRPLTREDVRPAASSGLFAGLESNSSRTLGGLLFAAIFFASRSFLEYSGLLMVILLVCVLYRLDSRERRIAAVPLAFATIRLALLLTAQFENSLLAAGGVVRNHQAFLDSLNWMPLLFAAYLFFAPWKESHTSRLIFWYSVALLLSGLIPGDGYLYISALLFYTLFMAVAFALVLDFAPEKTEQTRPSAPKGGAMAQPALS
jgi:hypothetical protein